MGCRKGRLKQKVWGGEEIKVRSSWEAENKKFLLNSLKGYKGLLLTTNARGGRGKVSWTSVTSPHRNYSHDSSIFILFTLVGPEHFSASHYLNYCLLVTQKKPFTVLS